MWNCFKRDHSSQVTCPSGSFVALQGDSFQTAGEKIAYMVSRRTHSRHALAKHLITREVREVTRSFSQTKRRVFRYWSKSSKTAFNFFGVHLWSSGDQRSILAVAMWFAAFALFSTVGLAEWSMALVRRRDFSECQVRLLPSGLFCLFVFFTFFSCFHV